MGFNFKIVTQDSTCVNEVVEEVMLGGFLGYFTIFENHSPFVTRLAISTGYYIKDSKVYSFSIKGGFCNVNNNEVTVITSRYIEENIVKTSECYDKTVKFSNISKEEVDEYFG